MSKDYNYYTIINFATTLNLKSDPVLNVPPGEIALPFCIEAINVDYRDGISIQSRDGYERAVANTYDKNIYGIFPFYIEDTRYLLIMTWDGTDYILLDETTSIDTGARSSMYFHPAVYNDLCFLPHYGNDDDEDYNQKYDGTDLTKLGIDAPASPCATADGSAPVGGIYTISARLKLRKIENDFPSTIIDDSLFFDIITCCIESDGVLYAGDTNGVLWKYDGTSIWEQAAPALNAEPILCLCEFGGNIYGGTGTSGKLYQWDGTSAWAEVAPQSGSETKILSLCVYDDGVGDDLYAGTYPSGQLLEWDDSSDWETIRATQSGSETGIYSLCVYDDDGGDDLYGGSGPNGKLLKWNEAGGWTEVADTYTGVAYINCMCTHNDGGGTDLYGGTDVGKILRWDDTDTWEQAAATYGADYDNIKTMVDYDGKLHLSVWQSVSEIYLLFYWDITNGWEYISLISYISRDGNKDTGGLVVEITISGQLTGTYYYYYSYYNSSTSQESALSPISLSTAPSAQMVSLSEIADSDDSQVDYKRIYRTGGTLTAINLIAEIGATITTYNDNIADYAVGAAVTCTDNDILAAVRGFCIHHHQLFGWYQDDYKGYVFGSKFYYPEAFPSTYFYRPGNATDYIVAVMPLGIDVMIYTRFNTYRLRYIGLSEGDAVVEEVAKVGLSSDNTLVSAVDPEGKEYHMFLGQSVKARGIYLNNGDAVLCISKPLEPLFNAERSAGDPIENITAIDWDYINTACAAFAGNKYYLAVAFSGDTKPKHIIVVDMDLRPARFHKITLGDTDDTINAMSYDLVADELMFGGDVKEVYKLTGTIDWVSGAAAGVSMVYQTPYFGQRDLYQQMVSLTFQANTQGQTLTVKIYADFTLKATLTTSTTSMKRVNLKMEADVQGRLFSVRFEITGSTTANKRIKISPPMVAKLAPWNKY